MIERLNSKDEVRQAVASARREGKRIGFVPTMGALHDGHLALVRAACMRTDLVVVSIFVNPTQFGEGEDFDAYPRRLADDISQLAAESVEIVFTPSAAEMYAPGASVVVDPGPLAARWEGEVRPGHFAGVATVVTKLLSIVRPDVAYFGEKDFQQFQIVRALARDLDLGCTIVGLPTVRDAAGLALSSRNALLTASEHRTALSLSAALSAAEQALAWGETDARALEDAMRDTVQRDGDGTVELDYAAVVDPDTLEPVDRVVAPARALIAGRIGATRLIDNCPLVPEGSAGA